MATLWFSETYNLFTVAGILGIIKECVLKLGISEVNTSPLENGVTLEASRKDISMRITLKGKTIGREGIGLFRGLPKVDIELAASSHDEERLADAVEEFKNCLLIRTARGGG